MIEPKPSKVAPPQHTEPTLMVGVVLKEDLKPFFRFSVPKEGYTVTGNGQVFKLSPAAHYVVHTSAGRLVIQDDNGQCFESATQPITIQPPADDCRVLAPQHGITVDSIVAGRHFHWRKDVVQTLPGSLLAYGDGEHLVLVNKITFEDYITCVLSSEMASECPKDFIKSQAVAARSWAMAFLTHKHVGTPYTVCNDDDCQRYQGTTYLTAPVITAVRECAGEFLVTDDGMVCAAYYAKNCGGISDLPEKILNVEAPGMESVPDTPENGNSCTANLSSKEEFARWLDSTHAQHSDVFCSPAVIKENELTKYLGAVDVKRSYYRWDCSITHSELAQLLREKTGLRDLAEIVDLVPGPRGPSGRLLEMTISYKTASGKIKSHHLPDQYEIRAALHQSFLLSSAFLHDYERTPDGRISAIRFRGAGWGHGVGLCQIGAVGRALRGQSYKEILAHYYPGTHLVKTY